LAKIENIDLGVITEIQKIEKRVWNVLQLPNMISIYRQNMLNEEHTWIIKGFLDNPSSTDINRLKTIRNHGLITYAEIDDYFFGFVKIDEILWRITEKEADIYNYEMKLIEQPAIGLTTSRTTNIYFHDLGYKAKYRSIYPLWGDFDASTNGLNEIFHFYLDNYAANAQDALIEIQCGDDIEKAVIYGFNGNAWDLIGEWGGLDNWGDTKSWTDPNSTSHNVTVEKGDRGETLTVGTVSRMLGCKKRLLMKFTNLTATTSNHVSTTYGGHQVKLKIQLIHTQIESSRPYARITYVEGGQEWGVP